jgi:hypothetical protein
MTLPTRPAERRWRSDPITRVASLLPFALAFYVDVIQRPLFGGPMSGQPEVLGISAAVWLQISVLSWAAVCAWVVWTTSSRVVSALAFMFGTITSVIVLVFGPALLLIWQNLGA